MNFASLDDARRFLDSLPGQYRLQRTQTLTLDTCGRSSHTELFTVLHPDGGAVAATTLDKAMQHLETPLPGTTPPCGPGG